MAEGGETLARREAESPGFLGDGKGIEIAVQDDVLGPAFSAFSAMG
ncbi:hypothetical protein KJ682_10315 [bacterium]|nr:hypothetical protein [bacterium]